MPKTAQSMMAEANAAVTKLSYTEARDLIAKGALVLDVRDGPEVEKTGKVAGALHISRGMLEFRADSATPYHDKTLQKDRPVLIYCASGGRAALSAKLLKDMGYAEVYNMGGFKDWADAGGATERALDPGM